MLDLIIPCYNAHNTIDRLLQSICTQINRELIKVTLIDDASDETYYKLAIYYRQFIDINVLRLDKNYGVGNARQTGIDYTNNPYVMFCDADDILYSNLTINHLLKPFTDSKVNYVCGDIIELKNNELKLVDRRSKIWVFGSIFRRKALEDNKIKFINKSVAEDLNFMRKFFLTNQADSIVHIEEPVYLWTDFNPGRISKGDFIVYKSFFGTIDALFDAYSHVEKVQPNNPSLKIQIAFDFISLWIQYQILKTNCPDRQIDALKALEHFIYSYKNKVDLKTLEEEFNKKSTMLCNKSIPIVGKDEFFKMFF